MAPTTYAVLQSSMAPLDTGAVAGALAEVLSVHDTRFSSIDAVTRARRAMGIIATDLEEVVARGLVDKLRANGIPAFGLRTADMVSFPKPLVTHGGRYTDECLVLTDLYDEHPVPWRQIVLFCCGRVVKRGTKMARAFPVMPPSRVPIFMRTSFETWAMTRVTDESSTDLLDIYAGEPKSHYRVTRTGFDYGEFADHPDSVHNFKALLSLVADRAQNAFRDADFDPTEQIDIFRDMRIYEKYNRWLLQLAYRQGDGEAEPE